MSRHGKKNRADGRGERVWELEEQQEQQQGAARMAENTTPRGAKRKAADAAEAVQSWRRLNKKIRAAMATERSAVSLDPNVTTRDCPLTQDDVVYFQKQALYRMFHLQYRKNVSLVETLSCVNDRCSRLVLYNSVLTQWWTQILGSLRTLFGVDVAQRAPAAVNDDILVSLAACGGGEAGAGAGGAGDVSTETLVANLDRLRDGLIQLLDAVFNRREPAAGSSTAAAAPQDQFLGLQNQVASLTVLRNTLHNENSLLKVSVAKLNAQIEDLTRQSDRSHSKALERIKDESVDSPSGVKQEQPAKTRSEAANNGTSNGSSEDVNGDMPVPDPQAANGTSNHNNNTAKDGEHANGSAGSGAIDPAKTRSEVEDLKLQIAAVEAKNQTLQQQLEEKIKLSFDLEKQVADLNPKSRHLSEDELLKLSSNYRSVVEENKSLKKSAEDLKLGKTKIENQMFELESKFSINKAKLESKYNVELENSNNYISKLETDINRIRSDRDALNAKIAVLKNEKGKTELISNFQKLIDTLQQRIEQLEEVQATNLSDLSSDEHNKIIINELKQIEQAFKSTREVSVAKLMKASDSETLINKLSVEKAKADEKYFQAMRAKDSLSSQNKVLSSNLTKQMELIEILKSNEEETQKKLAIEERLYENLQKVETLYKNDIVKLKITISSMEKNIRDKAETENELRSQISKYQFELQQLDKKLMSCQQDLSSEQRKIQNYKSLITSYRDGKAAEKPINGSVGTDSEIQQALLSMTKCSLCGKNFKNVALKTCGHCFCKDCVDDRLSARMRKCPSCNSQFSRYDLLTIHL